MGIKTVRSADPTIWIKTLAVILTLGYAITATGCVAAAAAGAGVGYAVGREDGDDDNGPDDVDDGDR